MAITQWQVSPTDITTNGVQAEVDVPVKLPTAMKTIFDRLPSYIVGKYNSLITELNTWWTTILSKIVVNGDGLSMFANDGTYRKAIPNTGFTNNSNINVSYNSTNRTITLTGAFEAYYNGKIVPELIHGWVSPAHADATGTYYLHYGEGGFTFGTDVWDFEDLMIAYVQKNSHNIGVREVHGKMEAECHVYDHTYWGTMKYAGGTFSNYTVGSTVVANRRPDISDTIVDDEDLRSTLLQLTSKSYTQRFLSGVGATRSFNIDQPEIIPVDGTNTQPYYNQNVGGTWQQTLFPNLSYGAIFVVAVPTTSDTESQKYRYMFVQPQIVSTNKLDIDNLTPASLVHGESTSLVSEYTFIGKIIIRYASNNWTIVETIGTLSGSKLQQISGVGTLPVASAIVSVPTGGISATNVQAALAELDTEKASIAHEARSFPSFLNSWITWGTSPISYFKDTLGFVNFEGGVSGGTITNGTVIMTLPVGYRPLQGTYVAVPCVDSFAELRFLTNGEVQIYSAVANTWVSFSGIRFPTT